MRMWSNRNTRALLVEIENGSATVENSLVVLQKVKHGINHMTQQLYS